MDLVGDVPGRSASERVNEVKRTGPLIAYGGSPGGDDGDSYYGIY